MKVACHLLMPMVCEILQDGARVRMTATGSSMRPFIRDGDVVELEPLDPASVRPGDVVLALLENGKNVLHRVARAQEDRLILKGDALRSPDPPVLKDRLVARVASVHRGGRSLRLDNSFWRLAGLLWSRSSLGPVLLWRFGRIRRALTGLLR
jgi:signal peptidase I